MGPLGANLGTRNRFTKFGIAFWLWQLTVPDFALDLMEKVKGAVMQKMEKVKGAVMQKMEKVKGAVMQKMEADIGSKETPQKRGRATP